MSYQTIVADPPWPQSAAGPLSRGGVAEGFIGSGASGKMPYGTMTVDAIAAMDVASVAAQNAHLYLWTTNRFLPDAYRVAEAWGFKPSTMLVWAKNPMGGGLGGAHGLATEYCLFARRGVLKATGRVGRNWWNWKRPYNAQGKPKHSAKPLAFYTMVEEISPGPYLEMFAREARPGWDVWGNQAPDAVMIDGLVT